MRTKLRDILVNWKKINQSYEEGYLVTQFTDEHNEWGYGLISTSELMKDTFVSMRETVLYLQFAFNAMKVLKLTQEWLKKVDTVDHKNDIGLYDLEQRINYVLDFIDEGGEDDATE